MRRLTASVLAPALALLLAIGVLAPVSGAQDGATGGIAWPQVVGGEPADIADYPWLVRVLDAQNPDPFRSGSCGATVIAPTWVLTAAHCVQEGNAIGGRTQEPWTLQVAVGIDPISSITWPERRLVTQVLVPDDYVEEPTTNDWALLRLAEPVAVPPVALWSDPTGPVAGTSTRIVGWGATHFRGAQQDHLRQADVPVVAGPQDPACGDYGASYLAGPMLCAGLLAGGIDACQGDSGGPLLVERDGAWVQVGTTSWGRGCAAPGYPGLYGRVSTALPWIEATMASTPPPDAPTSPPTGVQASGLGAGQAEVTWDPPAGAGPVQYWAITSEPGGITALVEPGQHRAVVIGLADEVPYTFTVKAIGGLGPGPASAPSGPAVSAWPRPGDLDAAWARTSPLAGIQILPSAGAWTAAGTTASGATVATRAIGAAPLSEIQIGRLTPDGDYDPSFAPASPTPGVLSLRAPQIPAPAAERGVRTAVHPDGTTTVLVALADDAGGVGVVQVSPAGDLDPSFGTGGVARLPLPGDDVIAHPGGLSLRADGSLALLACLVGAGGDPAEATLGSALISPAGQPITPGPAGPGLVEVPTGGAQVCGSAASDGDAFMTVGVDGIGTVTVARLTPGGTGLDPAFGAGSGVPGTVVLGTGTAASTWLDEAGRVLVGHTQGASLRTTRLSPLGAGDPSWVDAPVPLPAGHTTPWHVGQAFVDPLGRSLVPVGNAVVRLRPDGGADPSWAPTAASPGVLALRDAEDQAAVLPAATPWKVLVVGTRQSSGGSKVPAVRALFAASRATPPTGIAAEGGVGSIDVRWAPPANLVGLPLLGYRVSTDPESSTVELPATASGVLLDVPGDHDRASYVVQVEALTAAGPSAPGFSELVSVVDPEPPVPPAPPTPEPTVPPQPAPGPDLAPGGVTARSGSLPRTGASPVPWVAAGLMLLACGSVALALSRRAHR